MTTTVLEVTGLTCNNCVHHVTSELNELNGVTGVNVDLVAGGTSTVTVTSEDALARPAIEEALDEAGGYALVGLR